MSADAGGVLVSSPTGQLEVLAATSHRVADLEAYQTGAEQGPCVECLSKGRQIDVASAAEAAVERHHPPAKTRGLEAAYDALVALAEARRTSIAEAVTAVMDGARRGEAI